MGIRTVVTSSSDDNPRPICPECRKPMRLDRITPRRGGNPEQHTYICASCGDVLTFSEDRKDS